MELRNLKTFATIARLQSFARAADLLGYAPSTVTGQVQNLEEELGTVLFERYGQRIKLTRDGENLFWYAEQIVRLAEAARTAADDSPRGALAIGTPESFCLHCLPELLKGYRQSYPEVEIKLSFGTCCDLHAMLGKNLLDVAFILDRSIEDAGLVTVPLFEEPVLMLASPRHPLAGKAAVYPRDLDGQNLILTESGCSWRAYLEKVLADNSVRACPALEVSNVEIIKRFAKDNFGLTVLSRSVAAGELRTGELVALPWQGPDFTVKAQAVYHKGKWLSPALRAFLDLATAVLRPAADGQTRP